MASPKVTQVKVDFLDRFVLKKGTAKFLVALADQDLTYKELKKEAHVSNMNKMLRILAITTKYTNKDNIVTVGLTKKGRELAKHVKSLFVLLDDILPREE